MRPRRCPHHIVPGGGPQSGGRDATIAQDKLAELGIDLNGADNGVGLSPAFHSRLHTTGYYNFVNAQLIGVSTKQEAEAKPAQISEMLKQADATYQATGQLPTWTQ